ncbi:MAG: hypothetical protein R3F43_20820 [bacterium]
MAHGTMRELPPEYNGRGIAQTSSFSSITGTFWVTTVSGQGTFDVWSWDPNGTAPGSFYMGSEVTLPRSSVDFETNAQQFTGSHTSITPSNPSGNVGYKIEYQGMTIGYVTISPTSGTAQWWMYYTSYTMSGPYLPNPTNSKPLYFKQQSPTPPGQGWKGTDI